MMNKKCLAAAVAVLSLAASAAQANPNAPVQATTSTAGSSLILSVWDLNSNTSYSQVVLNGASPFTAAGFLASNSFAGETLSSAAWNKFVATETAGDDVRYEVQAAVYKSPSFSVLSTESTQADNAGGSSYAGNADVVAGLQSYLNNTQRISTFVTKFDNFETGLKGGVGTATLNDAAATASAANNYNAGLQLGFNVAGGLNTSDLAVVSVGSNASFFQATNTAGTTTASYLGAWNLTGNTLSYAAAPAPSAVPVPTAVWMMLSGLMGVLSLSRRKQA